MMGEFIKVKQRKRSIHKDCMKCSSKATVTAVYKTEKRLEMDMWFCKKHAEEAGMI